MSHYDVGVSMRLQFHKILSMNVLIFLSCFKMSEWIWQVHSIFSKFFQLALWLFQCNVLDLIETFSNKLKKMFCFKNISNLSLYEWSQKLFKLSAFSLELAKVFQESLVQLFLTVGHNNSQNKYLPVLITIPIWTFHVIL